MGWLARLLGKRDDEGADLRPLWDRIVAIAREPGWYLKGGVADSVAGRFDMVALVTALVMLRMERTSALLPASARLTERFIADMEGQLRQQGIGDPTLGKRLTELVGALGGRIGALRGALASADGAALAAAAERNVSYGEHGDPAAVAAELRALAAALAALDDGSLLAGEIVR